mmetsp:Transcript_21/g.74  ORF Transcript_21/g.74 Transcript_21/m.74 type:complete len:244 (+) Transcript_21:437-1168(+)
MRHSHTCSRHIQKHNQIRPSCRNCTGTSSRQRLPSCAAPSTLLPWRRLAQEDDVVVRAIDVPRRVEVSHGHRLCKRLGRARVKEDKGVAVLRHVTQDDVVAKVLRGRHGDEEDGEAARSSHMLDQGGPVQLCLRRRKQRQQGKQTLRVSVERVDIKGKGSVRLGDRGTVGRVQVDSVKEKQAQLHQVRRPNRCWARCWQGATDDILGQQKWLPKGRNGGDAGAPRVPCLLVRQPLYPHSQHET